MFSASALSPKPQVVPLISMSLHPSTRIPSMALVCFLFPSRKAGKKPRLRFNLGVEEGRKPNKEGHLSQFRPQLTPDSREISHDLHLITTLLEVTQPGDELYDKYIPEFNFRAILETLRPQ